jgi:hypothetical protein
MDYAFVAPNEDVTSSLIALLKQLPNTKVIQEPSVKSVQGFLEHLKKHNKKTGTLLIAGHGGEDNGISIGFPMTDGQKGTTDYETIVGDGLEPGLIATSKINIPKEICEKSGNGTLKNVNVIFRSCLIGKAPKGKTASPFLPKLKAAFGKHVGKVIAPKFILIVSGRKFQLQYMGTLEFMKYNFVIYSKKQFSSKVKLVKEFWTQFSDINRNQFSKKFFEAIVPEDKYIHKRKQEKKCWFNFGQPINKFWKIPVNKVYEYKFEFREMPITVPLAAEPPVKKRKEKLFSYAKQYYTKPLEYPLYERAGYKSLNDFLEGYKWKFNWCNAKKELTCMGSRHMYSIEVPICKPDYSQPNKPDDWILIFNYCEFGGSKCDVKKMEEQNNHNLLYTTV